MSVFFDFLSQYYKSTNIFRRYKIYYYFCFMNMKSFFICIIFAALAISCGKSYDEQKRLSRAERERLHRQDSLALKIAVVPTLDCLPIYVAKERVLYDTARLDLRLRYFTAQMDCDTAIAGRSVEGMVSDLVSTERLKREGTPLQYVSATNINWYMFTNRKARVKKLDQLGDKMVAMTRYSATDFLTDAALEGVKTSSVVFRIQVNDVFVRQAMLLNNEMDAMWLAEPQATVARLNGHSSIYDSQKKGLKLGVIAFRDDAMKDKRRKVQIELFKKAYNAACDSLNKYGIPHYYELLNKYYKLDERYVKALPKTQFEHIGKPRQKDIEAVATGKR